MRNFCYLCGNPAAHPLTVKDSFTAHSSARCPQSDRMCDRCYGSMAGDEKQLWYWNESKSKWSKLWGRSLSRLYLGDRLDTPTIEGTHTEGKDTFPVVSNLPTRIQMRRWLVNPPAPPFTIAIAESGQKHILFLAQESHSRDRFPVQFELDTLYIDRAEFIQLLNAYESLLRLGFSKEEINSGNYRSDRLMKALADYELWDALIFPYRGSRLLMLASYVAVPPTEIQPSN